MRALWLCQAVAIATAFLSFGNVAQARDDGPLAEVVASLCSSSTGEGGQLLAPLCSLLHPGGAQDSCSGLLPGILTPSCSSGPRAPDPGGIESPDQPVPAAGKHFGFNSSLAVSRLATPARELDLAASAGATAHRMPVSWRALQQAPGAPPLPAPDDNDVVALIDSFYAGALERGVTPIFIAFSAPVWASKYRSCGLLDLDCHWMARAEVTLVPDHPFLDEYERFVRAVKIRWPRALIESWNEPNHHWSHPYYTGGRAYAASPGHFAQIQCAAYRGSKAVNADPVLAAGWAWRRFSDYVAGVYEAGGADCWDRGNLHIYSQTVTELGENTWFAKRLHLLRTLRAKYGDTDPIWVTELGWTTSGGPKFRVSESAQADAARRAYNRLVTMPDIGGVLFHTLRDGSGLASDPWYGYGFMRENWSPKPVYCHFASQAGNSATGC